VDRPARPDDLDKTCRTCRETTVHRHRWNAKRWRPSCVPCLQTANRRYNRKRGAAQSPDEPAGPARPREGNLACRRCRGETLHRYAWNGGKGVWEAKCVPCWRRPPPTAAERLRQEALDGFV